MLLALMVAAADCPNGASVASMLAANHAATVVRASKKHALELRYTYSADGMIGQATAVIDTRTGAHVVERAAGLARGAKGFDGRQAWMRNFSAAYSPQSGGDKPALARNEAYRYANRWWRTDRDGARIERLACDALRVTPRDGKPFDAWFDPATGLLARIREQQSFGSVAESTFQHYRNYEGQLLPTRIAVITNDDPNSAQTFALNAAKLTARRPIDFAMPRTAPSDWSLPTAGSVKLPFRLLNNHVFVDVLIDGRGPFPFLVDTGGHNILTSSTLRALGLVAQGAAQSGGSGAATVTSGYIKVATIDAGGAVVRDQTMVTLDFSPPDVEGIDVGGMLGSEFLERFVVRFDYGASIMTLTDPKRFSEADRAAAGKAVPFTLYDHMPQVNGRFDAVSARLNIDTGSRSDVTMTSPFVARADLTRSYPDGITITDGWGVGGPARSRVVRGRSITLGSVVVPKPIVGLSAAKRGAFADANYDGNIGSGLLKRFIATFDYRRLLLYLKPIVRPDADTGRFDRVGMWLNQGTNGPEIMDIAVDSPAATGGLMVGDTIVAIDGVVVRERSLSDVRRMQKLLPVGKPVVIDYRRAGVPRSLSVLPRNLIPD